MAQLTYFKNSTNNYYLTEVLLTENEINKGFFQLPEYVTIDNKNYIYGIYNYAFYQVSINKIIIPDTVASQANGCFIYPKAFDGSNIPNIELYHITPPYMQARATVANTFGNLAEKVTITIPKNCNKAAYEYGGFISSDTVIIELSDSIRVRTNDRIIPSFYGYGESYSNITVGKDVDSIQDMAFFKIINDSEEASLFNIDNNNNNFIAEDSLGLVDIKNNAQKIIKGVFETESNQKLEIKSNYIVGPNAYTANEIINTITFNGEKIDSLAFQHLLNLETVEIGPNVKYIAENAFLDCRKLISITVNSENSYYGTIETGTSSVLYNKDTGAIIWGQIKSTKDLNNILKNTYLKSIPSFFKNSVSNDEKLTGELNIPKNINYIGRAAFRHNSFEKITFQKLREEAEPEAIIIDTAAFKQNSIVSIDFGNRPIKIGHEAFSTNKLSSPFELPDNIETIGDHAFGMHDSSLTLYYSQNNAKKFNNKTFGIAKSAIVYNNDNALEAKELKYEGDESRSTGLFYKYYPIENNQYVLCIYGQGRIPDWRRRQTDSDATNIDPPWRNEDYKDKIVQINIEEGVEAIGNYSFYELKALKVINLPSTIQATKDKLDKYGNIIESSNKDIGIGLGSLWNCYNLEKINVYDNNTSNFKTVHNVLYNRDQTIVYQYPLNGSQTRYWLPNQTTELYNDSLRKLQNLQSISMSSNLSKIAGYSLAECPNLRQIDHLEDTKMSEIPTRAFWNDEKLKYLTLPKNLKTIGDSAFLNCKSLASIAFPDTLTTIKNNAFQGCSSLTKIYISENVTEIEANAFQGCDNLIIYCQSLKKPSGWADDWNPDNRLVIWGWPQ